MLGLLPAFPFSVTSDVAQGIILLGSISTFMAMAMLFCSGTYENKRLFQIHFVMLFTLPTPSNILTGQARVVSYLNVTAFLSLVASFGW
jgi:hypothetical protein